MNQQVSFAFRKPSRAVAGLLLGLLVLWIAFAVATNWAGVGAQAFSYLLGDASLVFRGQIWRLLTAALLHHPNQVGHIIFSLLVLYFFATPLDERWGSRRLFTFLAMSAGFAYLVESLAWLVAPRVAGPAFFGGMVLADACLVAWALGARGETIRLYFVIPMKPMVLVWLMVGYNVLRIIALERPPEGQFAPFAAMAAGFFFGADQSPVRRAYLKWKLRRLQAEVDDLTSQKRRKRRNGPNLQVIKGGRDDDDDKILH